MIKLILLMFVFTFVSCSTFNHRRPKNLDDLIVYKNQGHWEIRNDAKNCFKEQESNAVYINSYRVDMRDAYTFVLLYYQNKMLFKPSSFSYKVATDNGNINETWTIEKQDFGTLRYEIKGCSSDDFYPSNLPNTYFYSVKIYNMK